MMTSPTSSESQYSKLSSSARSHKGGRWSLWAAENHFLMVKSTYVVEQYLRYDFRDIEGFLTTHAHRHHYINAFLILVLLIFGGIALKINDLGPSLFLAGIVGIPCLILLGLNLWRGPCCRFYVITRLGIRYFPAVSRRKRAEAIQRQFDAIQKALNERFKIA